MGAGCVRLVSQPAPGASIFSTHPREGILSGARTERRLAAILAVDVVGYSRLMGADEEGTLRRLKAIRAGLIDPKLAEHKGRLVKTTGDGLLAEFASVVDAVRCAAEVQRGMLDRGPELTDERRIRFRVGINLGDVIAEGDDIFGDGVNVAARLEALAEPRRDLRFRHGARPNPRQAALRARGQGRARGQEHCAPHTGLRREPGSHRRSTTFEHSDRSAAPMAHPAHRDRGSSRGSTGLCRRHVVALADYKTRPDTHSGSRHTCCATPRGTAAVDRRAALC